MNLRAAFVAGLFVATSCATLSDARKRLSPEERLDALFYGTAMECELQIDSGTISDEHRAACSVFSVTSDAPAPSPSPTKAHNVGPRDGGGVRAVE